MRSRINTLAVSFGSVFDRYNIINVGSVKHFVLILALLNSWSRLSAQNIMPNPDFESFNKCPNSQSTFEENVVNDWFRTHEWNSPDYYNACGKPGNFGIPQNVMGYQPAAGGNGYVGIWAYVPNIQYREFFACQLTQNLDSGVLYRISFKVALADVSQFFLDHLDFAFLSYYPYRQDQKEFMFTDKRHFQSERVLNDTSAWQTIYYDYVADGTEKYLMVGFIDWSFTGCNKIPYKAPKKVWRGAYYYFDQGEVVKMIGSDAVDTVETIPTVQEIVAEQFKDAWTTGFVLRGVFFDVDKYDIKPESYVQLDSVVLFMNLFPEVKIEVSGHTDSTATEEHNRVLSQNRALEVRRYLIAKGISETRIIAKGYASTRPRDTNKTVEGRANNRRVEFAVIQE